MKKKYIVAVAAVVIIGLGIGMGLQNKNNIVKDSNTDNEIVENTNDDINNTSEDKNTTEDQDSNNNGEVKNPGTLNEEVDGTFTTVEPGTPVFEEPPADVNITIPPGEKPNNVDNTNGSYNSTNGTDGYDPSKDLNNDGVVDIFDLILEEKQNS